MSEVSLKKREQEARDASITEVNTDEHPSTATTTRWDWKGLPFLEIGRALRAFPRRLPGRTAWERKQEPEMEFR